MREPDQNVTATSVRDIPEAGEVAPPFPLFAHGYAGNLHDLRGAPVVLLFQSDAWNPVAQELTAALQRVVAQFATTYDLQIVRVEQREGFHSFTFGDPAMSIAVIADLNETVAANYGVQGRNAVFILDEAGVVLWRTVSDPGNAIHPDALQHVLHSMTAHNRASAHAVPDDKQTLYEPERQSGWSRRQFVAASLAFTIATFFVPRSVRAKSAAAPEAIDDVAATMPVRLRVNGKGLSLQLDTGVTLLDALREYAGLTGTKKGCDHGQCGACTVHINGRRTLSCLTLAIMQQNSDITTIEGLAATVAAAGSQADKTALHPMQQAFITHDGFQCGFCTPGQIMSATGMLREPWGASDDEVREAMSGNICRCGAYPGILAAVQSVRSASLNAPAALKTNPGR